MNKEYVFVTGPSESGKSGAAEYMEKKFNNIKHLKMRDIIRLANIKVDDNTDQFWREYINMANQMSEEKSIIVMDTLRKPESAVILNKQLKNKMHILYIDADLKNRVVREYIKLKKEGKNVSLEEVFERTKQKDKEKEKLGLERLKTLTQNPEGMIQLEGKGEIYPNIIDNNGELYELYSKLDEFINELERKIKQEIER